MKFDKLLPLVLPKVRNVPKVAAVIEIRDAAICFFENTLAWQKTLDAVALAPGATEVAMVVPTGTVVTKVLSVVDEHGTDVPYISDRTTVTVEAAGVARTITANVALKPTATAEEFDDDLFDEFGGAIAKGAVAQLKAQGGAEWFDQAGAAVAMKLFEDAVASEKRKAFAGTRSGNIYVKRVPFF